jgi:TonB family protein
MLTGEAPPIPSSEETAEQPRTRSAHELHLLLSEMEDERDRSRWREAIWISTILHLLVFISVLIAPKVFPHRDSFLLVSPEQQLKDRDMTFLELPPDLQKKVPPPKTDIISDKNRIATSRQPQPDRELLRKLLDARKPGPPGPAPPPLQAKPQPAPQVAAGAPQQSPQKENPIQQKPDDKSLSAKLESPPVGAANPGMFKNPMSAGSAIEEAARSAAARRGAGGDYGLESLRPHSPVQSEVDILSDTLGVDFGPYLERVLHDVRINWYNLIPEVARPPLMKKGKVGIEFAISKNGSVMGMKLYGPSGDVSLDRAAWGGITASNPFPPLPGEFKGEYLALRFRFYYNPDKNDLR